MNSEADKFSDPHFEERVRETAYFLWEQDGRPEGREQEYWFRALERSLRERNADGSLQQSPPVGTGGPKPTTEDGGRAASDEPSGP